MSYDVCNIPILEGMFEEWDNNTNARLEWIKGLVLSLSMRS